MPLVPPQGYLNIQFIHRRGLAAARPAAADVVTGTLYFSTDTGVLERSNGTIWDSFASGGTSIVIPPQLFLPSGAEPDDNVQVPLIGSNIAKYDDFNPTFRFDVTINQQLVVNDSVAFLGAVALITGSASIGTLSVTNAPVDLLGGQIKFPAIQNPSADPNTLDDYEEVPSFTPTLVSSGGGTPTYTTQTGRATKEGDKVTGSFFIQLTNLGTLAAGTLTIAGMPFTAGATNGIPFMCIFAGLGVNQIYIYSVINPSTTSLLVRKQTAAAASNVADLTVADIGVNFVIAGGFVYFV